MKQLAITGALLLAACASPTPSGPSILVLPGTGRTFDQFRADDSECRVYARDQIAGSQQQGYDNAFTQCMYAKGHRVPVAGRYSSEARGGDNQQAARQPPPPPPGQPPPEAPPDYRPR